MPKTDDDAEAEAMRLLVIFLRSFGDLKQMELAEVSGVQQGVISRYESGKNEPPERMVRRIAAAVGVPWPVARDLARCFSAVIRRTGRHWEGEGLAEGMLDAILEPALMMVFPYLVEELTAEPAPPSPEDQRREAEQIWKNLQNLPPGRRRRVLEVGHGFYPDWALAERICEASLQRADGEPDQALELADWALSIATRMTGQESRRSRVEGYCWAHVAHARRAAGDLAGAQEASLRAWDLWQAGAKGDPGLLAESRLRALAGDPPAPRGTPLGPPASPPAG